MKRNLWMLSLLIFIGEAHSQINLASNGTASQSSTYKDYNASLAITGGPTHDFETGSCSVAGTGEKVAWWMLTFSLETVFTSNVIIYYRKDLPQRLAGYSLYISNSSIDSSPPSYGHLCYHHNGSNIPDIFQNITCDHLGRNVIMYNERKKGITYPGADNTKAFLELCDVQIIGCHKSWWGGGCRKPCPAYCTNQHCNPTNGTCIWGCSSINCLKNECYNDGTCRAGCIKGQGGSFCNAKNVAKETLSVISDTPNQEKFLVTDGDKRRNSCVTLNGTDSWLEIDTLEPHVIKTINVVLKDGLSDLGYSVFITNSTDDRSEALNLTNDNSVIYTFPFPVYEHNLDSVIVGRFVILSNTAISAEICEVEIIGCQPGVYGELCEKKCPSHCSGPCHLESGICVFGCQDGYNGSTCEEECAHPYFGRQCSEICHCINQPCHFGNGTCPIGGCLEGWEGHSCSKECGRGMFGKNCNESCDGCLLTECKADNGTCKDTSGCQPGWEPGNSMCNIECKDGHFGNCFTQCHCLSDFCEKSTGVCPGKKCDRGWMGETCSDECTFGTYGYDCADTCDGCVNKTCDIFEGNCTYGCLPGYEGFNCQIQVEEGDPQLTSSPAGAIGGGIGGTLAVLMIAIAVVFFIRRRSNNPDKKEQYTTGSSSTKKKDTTTSGKKRKTTSAADGDQYANVGSVDTSEIHLSQTGNKKDCTSGIKDSVYINHGNELDDDSLGDGSDIYSNAETTRYSVDSLHKIIKEKQVENGFKEDFENLPKGLLKPHKEGSKEENKSKNRFLSTWPYDHSRVILHGNGASDYINASYIDSYTKRKAYIATQGPKQNTVKDFWHMVWQENVEIIVMVTKVEENSKKKCYPYWPQSTANQQNVGHYKLSSIQESENALYVHRKFHVFNKNDKEGRDVHQFHYLQWDDHDVPDTIKLINFYRKIKHVNTTLDGPIVVHCSAGIGRTGTFIAIDALYENGLKTGFIDVLEYVQIMRQDRMNMIQTKDQYATVYDALHEAFTVPDSSVGKDEFCSVFEMDNSEKIPKNQRKISVEYRKLQDIKPSYTKDDYSAAKLDDNISKNANQKILPNNRYRPYLMSHGKTRTDYINAVIIPSYVRQRNIIVTQFPLKTTVEDFWTLIFDTDCSSIVFLEKINDNIKLLPNEDKSLTFEIFEVSKVRCKPPNVNVRMDHQGNGESKLVKVLFVKDWPAESTIPPSEKCLLDIQASLSHDVVSSSIAVVCRDGCIRSGIFVALNLTMQKLDLENEVDLFHVVRMMQIRRPEFISHPEEYEYCYKCIRQHLEMDSLYANVR